MHDVPQGHMAQEPAPMEVSQEVCLADLSPNALSLLGKICQLLSDETRNGRKSIRDSLVGKEVTRAELSSLQSAVGEIERSHAARTNKRIAAELLGIKKRLLQVTDLLSVLSS